MFETVNFAGEHNASTMDYAYKVARTFGNLQAKENLTDEELKQLLFLREELLIIQRNQKEQRKLRRVTNVSHSYQSELKAQSY